MDLPKINIEDILPYEDGLREIIPDKLEEILSEMEACNLKHECMKIAITRLKQRGELDEFGVWYWAYWNELEYLRYYNCRLRLKYWLDIYEKLPNVIMPKRMKTELDRSKIERARMIPIEEHYTDKLRVNGSRLIGKCPFHEERTASFDIYRQTNSYFCFGCKKGGDVIDFIMRLRHISFMEAVEYLL